MKIIVFSDNHGDVNVLHRVRKKHLDITTFLHCGDYCATEKNDWMIRVVGNCDNDTQPTHHFITLQNKKIMITHGHLYHRHRLIEDLVIEAKKNHVDIVCFGHIHRRVHEIFDNIVIVNPGSLVYNYDGTIPGYAIIDLDTLEVEFEWIGE